MRTGPPVPVPHLLQQPLVRLPLEVHVERGPLDLVERADQFLQVHRRAEERDLLPHLFLPPPAEPGQEIASVCILFPFLAQNLEHRLQRLTPRLQVGGDGFRQRVDL